jgi:hypothetical protein
LDLFGGIEATVERQIVRRLDEAMGWIAPSYLMDDPYRSLLVAVARGDGKLFNVFRRAQLSETVGGQLVRELVTQGVVSLEASREPPIRRWHGQQLPRELRGYRIQSKVRFVRPFDRFWFGFVVPFLGELTRGETQQFWTHLRRHRSRASSLIFEQLSNALLEQTFLADDPIISSGGWWDRRSEYDVLAFTRSGRMILGECKYTGRSITKGELTKLQDKAAQTGFAVDTWVLFSRSGFSRELSGMADDTLLLFGVEDFEWLATPARVRPPAGSQ